MILVLTRQRFYRGQNQSQVVLGICKFLLGFHSLANEVVIFFLISILDAGWLYLIIKQIYLMFPFYVDLRRTT